jgi:hypothetical protein
LVILAIQAIRTIGGCGYVGASQPTQIITFKKKEDKKNEN